MNKKDTLDNITARILQNLKNLQGAPSVQMHPVPPDWVINSQTPQEIEDKNPDSRPEALTSDGALKKERDDEFYDGDKDNDKGKNRYLMPQTTTNSANEETTADNNDAMD